MITRGTTPIFEFTLPEFEATISKGVVSFRQGKKVLINKFFTEDDVTRGEEGIELEVSLTQEETLSFNFYDVPAKDMIEIQVKMLDEEGDVSASSKMIERVGDAVYEEELS